MATFRAFSGGRLLNSASGHLGLISSRALLSISRLVQASVLAVPADHAGGQKKCLNGVTL